MVSYGLYCMDHLSLKRLCHLDLLADFFFFYFVSKLPTPCLFTSSGKCECKEQVLGNSKAFCGMKYSYGESEVHECFQGSIQTTCTKSVEGNEWLGL